MVISTLRKVFRSQVDDTLKMMVFIKLKIYGKMMMVCELLTVKLSG